MGMGIRKHSPKDVQQPFIIIKSPVRDEGEALHHFTTLLRPRERRGARGRGGGDRLSTDIGVLPFGGVLRDPTVLQPGLVTPIIGLGGLPCPRDPPSTFLE